MATLELNIPSARGSQLNSLIVEGNQGGPLIMMIHGFKANRTEDGRFLQTAQALAEDGFNSIMFSQAGCGESYEEFIDYTLDNSLSDMEACLAWMKEHYHTDDAHTGLIGYSMGGRLVSLFAERHPEIRTLALWAAASVLDMSADFLGNDIHVLRTEAAEKGWCSFYNAFDGQTLQMNGILLDNLAQYDPLESLKKYQGDALVIHGSQDITVDKAASFAAYGALQSAEHRKLYIIDGADHGFGAWDNRPDLSEKLTGETISFFRKYL